MSEQMYVYIITNQSHSVFYTGVTNNLERRILEHKQKIDLNSFSARYNCNKLVYYESGGDPEGAITREKQIKNYRREKKIALVESQNLYWKDLSREWYDPYEDFSASRSKGLVPREGIMMVRIRETGMRGKRNKNKFSKNYIS